MLVKDRMTSNPTYVKPDHTLAAAKAVMDAEDIRHVPVVDRGRLVGILTDRDLQRHWGYLDTTRVDAAMVANPVTAKPDMSIETAALLLTANRVRSLPVVDGEKLVGIITTTDMLGALLDVLQATRRIMAND
jgi:acetoin utilization protein AcuB